MKELTRQMSIDELSISDVELNISGVECGGGGGLICKELLTECETLLLHSQR